MIKNLGLFIISILCFGCSSESTAEREEAVIPDASTFGSGYFEYSDYEPFAEKPMRIFYHIPSNSSGITPILFTFHGASRNARDYRNAFINYADAMGFIVVAPEFSSTVFPGGDAYNLGNVFIDGDNPLPTSLNPEEEWTFSVIEPLFDFFRNKIANSNATYNIFGHSAGGQFAHRFVMFKPNARLDKIVASASGWYTATDLSIQFPYGFGNSPLENISFMNLFEKDLTILVGDLDNNPNASGLRRNEFADVQGINRFARAQNFYNNANEHSQDLNLGFNWALEINSGADHNFRLAISKAADLLFND